MYKKITETEKLQGLSLSLCINDVLSGVVKKDQVDCIVASTAVSTPAKFEQVLAGYAKTYWHDAPEQAKALAREFFKAGKIQQPRLSQGGTATNIADGKWRKAGGSRKFNVEA